MNGEVSSARRPVIGIALAISVSLALAACATGPPSAGSAATTTVGPAVISTAGSSATTAVEVTAASATAASTASLQWSYTGETGPDHWGEMVASCQSGTSSSQSPINIDSSILVPESPSSAGAVTVNYLPTVFEVENTGNTIEVVPDDLNANDIIIDGKTFYLQQFHFHGPSEHTIDNQSFPMELHLVNKSDDGAIAVLGVPLTAGVENAALAELFAKMPAAVSDEESMVPLDGKIDPTELIPPGSAIARYSGSLTTPPCTEPVLWSVFLTPSSVSTDQIVNFQKIFADNHRPTQPTNNRVINEVQEG